MLWLKSNILNKLTNTLHFQSFYAPLTSQVEELDQTTDTTCSISHTPSPAWQLSDTLRLQQHVTLDIPDGHTYRNASHTETELKQGVLNRSIASEAWDTSCTSNSGKICDPFIQTSQPFTKDFSIADGRLHAGTNISKLHHPVQEPARTVDMVPALAYQSLLSGRNVSEIGYISIYNDKEVNIYDGCTARIIVSETEVLKGRKCPRTKL